MPEAIDFASETSFNFGLFTWSRHPISACNLSKYLINIMEMDAVVTISHVTEYAWKNLLCWLKLWYLLPFLTPLPQCLWSYYRKFCSLLFCMDILIMSSMKTVGLTHLRNEINCVKECILKSRFRQLTFQWCWFFSSTAL